ncbi:DUF3573 domain-containing protein [Francisella tularensis]|uniref:DUF3573 domain-containing protein n=1 Tax=Francisella tularensis TaxID=263 RepID=UPI00018554DB|nr:DUF3573 domain-containing protein [Francisella tularensis]EDZ90485.1 conserved hypothetical protein [Francisella tularensis subsp. novicida FTG]
MCSICHSYAELNNQTSIFELQKQIKELQAEINHFEETKMNENFEFTTYSSEVVDSKSKLRNKETKVLYTVQNNNVDIIQNISPESTIIDLRGKPLGKIFNQNGSIDVGNAPAITTDGQAAYLGSYSGNNSIPIGMIPGKLFASTIILQKEKFDQYSIFLGGLIRVDAQTWFGDSIPRVDFNNNPITSFDSKGQNIYLSTARLFFLANMGNYITAAYDVSTSELNDFNIGDAFVIIGNMDVSPYFITVGKSTLTIANLGGGGPSTSGIANFLNTGRATNISLNYKTSALNVSVAFFSTNNQKANFSAGLFYADKWTDNLSVGFNTGYVYDLAGAENSSIPRIALNKTIGAFSIDANIAYTINSGIFQINSGWGSTTNSFDFNLTGENVLAGAWYIAGNYSANIFGRNSNFNATYGESYNAAAIPMSIAGSRLQNGLSKSGIKRQIIFSAQRSYFDDSVLFGPEYAYQKFYNDVKHHALSLDMSIYL